MGSEWIPTPIEISPIEISPAKRNRSGLPRADTTVEGMIRLGRFVDEGCDLAAKCLKCPLEICQFEVGASVTLTANTRQERNKDIRREYRRVAALGMAALYHTAATFHLSTRSIHRILAGDNKAPSQIPVPVIPGPEKYFKAPRPLPAIRRQHDTHNFRNT